MHYPKGTQLSQSVQITWNYTISTKFYFGYVNFILQYRQDLGDRPAFYPKNLSKSLDSLRRAKAVGPGQPPLFTRMDFFPGRG